jgi:hypothetical protein
MGRNPAPVVIHRLSAAEQRVLASFLSGRLPAGQVDAELARAREVEPAKLPSPALQPAVAA